MSTKNNPGTFDCYSRAMPDEPMFVLLGRDIIAPGIIEHWASERQYQIDRGIKPKTDQYLVTQAKEIADAMREWRRANNGAWRSTDGQ